MGYCAISVLTEKNVLTLLFNLSINVIERITHTAYGFISICV